MPSLTKVYLGRPAAVIATVVMKTLETESGYGCSRSDRCSADRNLIGGPPLSVNEWDWFRVTVFCLLARVIPFFFFFFPKKIYHEWSLATFAPHLPSHLGMSNTVRPVSVFMSSLRGWFFFAMRLRQITLNKERVPRPYDVFWHWGFRLCQILVNCAEALSSAESAFIKQDRLFWHPKHQFGNP